MGVDFHIKANNSKLDLPILEGGVLLRKSAKSAIRKRRTQWSDLEVEPSSKH